LLIADNFRGELVLGSRALSRERLTLGELIDILGFDGDLFALELSVSLQGRHALSSFGLIIVQTPQLPVMLLDALVAIVDNLSNFLLA
jgi:hypothetical protein